MAWHEWKHLAMQSNWMCTVVKPESGTNYSNAKVAEVAQTRLLRSRRLSQPEHGFWLQGRHVHICRDVVPCSVSVFLPLVGSQSALMNSCYQNTSVDSWNIPCASSCSGVRPCGIPVIETARMSEFRINSAWYAKHRLHHAFLFELLFL
jgi:hypothetical protein